MWSLEKKRGWRSKLWNWMSSSRERERGREGGEEVKQRDEELACETPHSEVAREETREEIRR